jgi:hypothetical protein
LKKDCSAQKLKEISRMKSRMQALASVVTVLVFALTLALPAFAADKAQTLTGTVSDAMCGAKHSGDAATCTRGCVKKGSKYALVVGDKVYTLDGGDADLDKLAGQKATVTGTVDGDKVKVATVKAAA